MAASRKPTFADAPDVQQLLAAEDYADLLTGVEDIVSYADSIVSTINPAISIDGSDAENAPRAQTKPHVCNKPYADVKDINLDLVEMIATCQRHTLLPSILSEEEKGSSGVSLRISQASAAHHYNQHGRQHTYTADSAK